MGSDPLQPISCGWSKVDKECKAGGYTNPETEIGLGYKAGVQARRPSPEQLDEDRAAHEYCTKDCFDYDTTEAWACGTLSAAEGSIPACVPVN